MRLQNTPRAPVVNRPKAASPTEPQSTNEGVSRSENDNTSTKPKKRQLSSIERLRRAVARDFKRFSSELRTELESIFAVVANHRSTCKRLAEVITRDEWPMQMNLADERMMIAECLAAIELPNTRAHITPFDAVVVTASTDGLAQKFSPLEVIDACLKSNADVIVLPEWSFLTELGAPLSAAQFDQTLQTLVDKMKGSSRLLVPGTLLWTDGVTLYNTAVAISDGRVLKMVHKRGDGNDVDIAHKHQLNFPTRKKERAACHIDDSNSLFQHRGMLMSLEICRDHGDGRVRHDLLFSKTPIVDVQLIVSTGVHVKHPAVGIGGVVLLAQGNHPLDSELYQRRAGDGRLQTVETTTTQFGHDSDNVAITLTHAHFEPLA